ncbi:hypothetical protein FQN60_010327 [Etheostoma spectabile]|uniref:Uncharacterized protein n=1 Tax=Etheostoma spectabile TaxID=54343 RepID=A0A5J5D2N4_9PERO|nr:hypothetical protein FQN60_010327 [Etheostoma spectabile]
MAPSWISGGVHWELPAAKPRVGTITILSTSALQNGKEPDPVEATRQLGKHTDPPPLQLSALCAHISKLLGPSHRFDDPGESQAEKLASFSVCARQCSLAWPGRRSGGARARIPNMCENTATRLALCRCTHLVRVYVDIGQHSPVGIVLGLKHTGRVSSSSSRFAVGRDVEAAKRTRLGWEKSGNLRMPLSFCSSVHRQ